MDYNRLLEELNGEKRIVVTAHKSPDGDAIGSLVGLASVLSLKGHQVTSIVPDAYPGFLDWMDPNNRVMIFDAAPNEAISKIEEAEIIFSLDYNNFDRVGDMKDFLASSKAKKVLIDHHLSPDDCFDYVLSDTSASSTAELIYRFLTEMSYEEYIDKHVSECLYAGIMTDTGSFRFSSTGPKTHRIAADLMERGMEPSIIHQRIYDTNSLSRLKMIGFALSEKLEVIPDMHVAIIGLSLSEKNRFGYKKGDTEGLVNYGLSVGGVEVAVFLSEESGFVKFSFRSKGKIDVNQIARKHFNGGGHRNAAGGKLDMSLKDALSFLKTVINEEMH